MMHGTLYFYYTTFPCFLQPVFKNPMSPLQPESLFTKTHAPNGKKPTFCIKPVDSLHWLCYNIGIKVKSPFFMKVRFNHYAKRRNEIIYIPREYRDPGARNQSRIFRIHPPHRAVRVPLFPAGKSRPQSVPSPL